VRSAEQLGLGEGARLYLWGVLELLSASSIIVCHGLEGAIIAVCEPKSKNGLDFLTVSDFWMDTIELTPSPFIQNLLLVSIRVDRSFVLSYAASWCC